MTEQALEPDLGMDITDGGPDMIQFLTSDGELKPNANTEPYAKYAEELDDEALKGLLRDMMLTRRLDAQAIALQRTGELGLWGACQGQEAAQIGLGRALRKQDFVFPGYREHGVALCRGIDPVQLLAMWRGVNHGGWDPHEINFNLYTVVIGNQMLNATGYAMGVQRDGDVGTGEEDRDTAVVACTGDGGTSQGDCMEAYNIAAVNNSPIVFFIQNNHWAISERNENEFKVPPYVRPRGFGFPGVRVDGNDVIASYAVAKYALDHARSGQGPILIEAFTYRMASHTTSDEASRYRSSAEVEMWAAKDPVDRVVKYLTAKGAIDEAWMKQVEADGDELSARLREGCTTMEAQPMSALYDYTYAEPFPEHELEKKQWQEFAATLEEN